MGDISLVMAALFAVAAFYEQYARNRAYRWLDYARQEGRGLLATLRARKGLGGPVDSTERLQSIFEPPLTIALSKYSSRALVALNVGLFALGLLRGSYFMTADVAQWNLSFLATLCFLGVHLGMALLIERGNIEFERERLQSCQDLGDGIVLDLASSLFLVSQGAPPEPMERFDSNREVGGAPIDVLYSSRSQFIEAELARAVVVRLRNLGALSTLGQGDAFAIEQGCDLLDAIQQKWRNSPPTDWRRLKERLERRQTWVVAEELGTSSRGLRALGDLCDARTAEILCYWMENTLLRREHGVSSDAIGQLRDTVIPRALNRCAAGVTANLSDVPEWLFPESFRSWRQAIASARDERAQRGIRVLIARGFTRASAPIASADCLGCGDHLLLDVPG